MAPGSNVAVYGRFPTEVSTDPASIKNMDVYFNSGLSRGCGTEDSSRQVPAGMGSNKVGGGRRGGRGRRTMRRRSGGGLQDVINGTVNSVSNGFTQASLFRPFLPSAYPNPLQNAYEQAVGNPAAVPTYNPGIPTPSSPVEQTWSYRSNGIAGAINPGIVTGITKDLTSLASPPPWTN
jgi:hypothetical protein